MLRWALPAAFCFMAAVPASAEVSVTPADRGYDIDVTGQASASELLNAISSTTGATIKGQPEEAPITANQLRGISIERALRKLLPGASFAISYGDDGKPSSIIFLSPDTAASDPAAAGDAPAPAIQDPAAASDGSDSGDSGEDTSQPSQ